MIADDAPQEDAGRASHMHLFSVARLHGHLLLEGVQGDAAVHARIAIRRQHVVGAAGIVAHTLWCPASHAQEVLRRLTPRASRGSPARAAKTRRLQELERARCR